MGEQADKAKAKLKEMIPFMSLEKPGEDFWAEMNQPPDQVNYYVAGKKAGAFLSQAIGDIVSVFVPVAKGAQIVGKLAGSPRLLTSLKKAPSGKFHREAKSPDTPPKKAGPTETPSGQPVVKTKDGPDCGVNGYCFVAGTPVSTAKGAVAIETLKVGDRVLTGTGDSSTEIVSEHWRMVSLALENPENPANTLWLTMLRSTQWVSTASCHVGGRFFLELEELGLKGWATVREIAPCPEIQPGEGRVITATFNHYGSDVLELRLEGESEPPRPTSRHPIFSETRQEWVTAMELKAGELVKTASGSVKLESITRVPGMHRVYNMEVEGGHQYFAGEAEVLSHNTGVPGVPGCSGQPGIPLLNSQFAKNLLAYLRAIENYTGFRIHKAQRQILESHLRTTVFQRLTKPAGEAHRRKFPTRVKNRLISEWEKKTGQDWPSYKKDVLGDDGKVLRKAGDPYDAHHIIENVYGGPHEWWNLTPARFPDQHQGGIHTDPSMDALFP